MRTPPAHNSPRRSFFLYGFIVLNGGTLRNALHSHRCISPRRRHALPVGYVPIAAPGWMGTPHGGVHPGTCYTLTGYITPCRCHSLPVGYVPIAADCMRTPHNDTPRNALHPHRLYTAAPLSYLAGLLYVPITAADCMRTPHGAHPERSTLSPALFSFTQAAAFIPAKKRIATYTTAPPSCLAGRLCADSRPRLDGNAPRRHTPVAALICFYKTLNAAYECFRRIPFKAGIKK